MNPSLRLTNRYLWIGLIFLVLLALVSFVAAPATHRLTSGSTWNAGPDGYGAWYAYLEKQDVPVQRWQRPVSELLEKPPKGSKTPLTLVQVQPDFEDPNLFYGIRPWLSDWLKAGNRVIVLGRKETATAAPFVTEHTSKAGNVKLETRRRRVNLDKEWETAVLQDGFGAIAWQTTDQTIEQTTEQTGQLIFVVTPHIAANAYQGEPGNFAFLADLATQAKGSIWIDEYLHGYKDQDVVVEESGGTWFTYLAKTPLRVAFVQIGLVALVFILAQNRQLGVKQRIKSPLVDNSEAYIRALAGVLHKAESHGFVASTLGKAERLTLQKALGLGEAPVSDETLQLAWRQATGQSAEALDPVIAGPTQLRREQDLKAWLDQLQTLHRSLAERSSAR